MELGKVFYISIPVVVISAFFFNLYPYFFGDDKDKTKIPKKDIFKDSDFRITLGFHILLAAFVDVIFILMGDTPNALESVYIGASAPALYLQIAKTGKKPPAQSED